MKKALSLALALVMCLGLTVPAFAAETEELREGISLTGIIGEEMIPASPLAIPLYKVEFPATLVISGCGRTDEYGYIRVANMTAEVYEAVQNGPDEPAGWNFEENGPYIPGKWVFGDQIAELKWTENGVYTFDQSYTGKTVYLTLNEEWESTGKGGPNGLPGSGWTEVMIQFPETEVTTQPENPTDAPDYQVSNWAKDRVALAVETGLAADSLGNDYRVDITRAQFAATAVKLYEAMSGEKVPAVTENPFTDTTDPVILQAASMGFVSGVGNGKFDPNALVTREQACVMLSSVFTKLGGEIPAVEATTFADNADVAGWARNAVAFMNGKEIVTGIGDNNFGPKGNASIEQALLIALKMYENLK